MRKIILIAAAAAAMCAPAANAQISDLLRGAAGAMMGSNSQQEQPAQQQPAQQQTQQQQGGGLGSLLGGFLGGGQTETPAQPAQQTQQQPSGGSAGGMLGGLIGGLTGGNGGSGATDGIVSGLTGLIEGVLSTSQLTEADLVGTWRYSAPAVSFQSENFLQKAGGAAAAGMIEQKIAPYYNKVGINQLVATFNADRTFTFKVKSVGLSGTYQLNNEAGMPGVFTFTFTVGGAVPVGSFDAYVEKVGNKISIEFDATRLITIVNAVAQISGQATLQTVASMLNSYDGLLCGFQLVR